MGLVSRTLDGLFNGISQQPATIRLDSQCEIQENILGTILDGITPRYPTEYISTLSSTSLDEKSFIHKINRDSDEQYLVFFTGNSNEPIEVYTLDGTKCTIKYETYTLSRAESPGGNTIIEEYNTKDYITITNPKDSVKAISVADYTFVLNKDKSPETIHLPFTPLVPPATAMAYVKKGIANIDYEIYVDGSQKAIYSSGDGGSSYKTDTIASDLYNDLMTNLGTANWNISLLDSVIYFSRKDGEEFTLRVSDSWGEQALQGIKGSVQKFTDLPPKAPVGYFCEVTGDGSSSFDNYYVNFTWDNVWKETVARGLANGFNPSTLPHRLVRTDYNTFTFSHIAWEERKVGDETSSPTPSFVGYTINDIFFYKNRLGFLANDGVILSRSGSYFNFYPTTATDVLDDDPIDISVSTNQVNILQNALPGYNTNLLVDSGTQQFLVTSKDNLFTSKSVSIESSTSFETDTKCPPILAGTNAYFVSKVGNYSNIREYFLQPNTLINDASNITAHVPYYLPKITKLESNSSIDIIFAFSPSERKNLYVYKYYWSGQEKAQSSWSKWVFDEDIYDIAIFNCCLYLIQKSSSSDGFYISKINLTKETSGDLRMKVRLDKQVSIQGVYNSNTNKTIWTLPYTDTSDNFIVVTSTGNKVSSLTRSSSTTISATGNFTSSTCYIGKYYTSKYRFSTFYVKGQDGEVANLNYKLQLRKLIVSYANTGYFRLEVTPLRRETITNEVLSTIIGVSQFGALNLATDKKDFLVMSSSKDTTIDIVSDSYLPFSIQSVTWQGILVSLSSNI